jgi:hypothetical protein
MELDRCSASSKNDHRVEQIADPNTEEEERKVRENRGENQQREATIPRSTTGDGGARKERGGSSRRSHQSHSRPAFMEIFLSPLVRKVPPPLTKTELTTATRITTSIAWQQQ